MKLITKPLKGVLERAKEKPTNAKMKRVKWERLQPCLYSIFPLFKLFLIVSQNSSNILEKSKRHLYEEIKKNGETVQISTFKFRIETSKLTKMFH